MTNAHEAGGVKGADEVRDHVYDGIQEFDNRLPNWWLWTFYGACIFSFFYWVHFHVLGTGNLPYQKFQDEMAVAQSRAEAEQAASLDDAAFVELSKDEALVAEGRELFLTNCQSCHLASAGGMTGLGPNLTDKFWLHGGEPTKILHTITEGVPGTAMVAWKYSLDFEARKRLVAYIGSIRDTNVEGGLPPQGDPYEGR